MGRLTQLSRDDVVPLEGSGIEPQTRTWILLARMIELCFTGTAVGLACHVAIDTKVSWWPQGADDHELIVFLVLVSFLGVISTTFGLIVLCFKYESSDFASKTGHKICGANFLTVWVGLIYFAVSVGAINYAYKYLGDAGLRCTGDALKSYRACAMMLGIVVSTGIGAGMAFICAVIEGFRIKQWNRVLKQCRRS